MPSGGDFFPDLPLDRFPSGLSEKHTEVSGRQSVLPPSSRRFPAPFGFGGFFVSVPSLFRCGMRSGLSGGTRLQGCAGISDCLSACLSYGRTPSRHRCGLFALWLRRGVLFVRFRLFFGTECATTFPGTEEGVMVYADVPAVAKFYSRFRQPVPQLSIRDCPVCIPPRPGGRRKSVPSEGRCRITESQKISAGEKERSLFSCVRGARRVSARSTEFLRVCGAARRGGSPVTRCRDVSCLLPEFLSVCIYARPVRHGRWRENR